jgi:hypothetical protein
LPEETQRVKGWKKKADGVEIEIERRGYMVHVKISEMEMKAACGVIFQLAGCWVGGWVEV